MKTEELELDPNFTPAEHEEFELLEQQFPYKEEHEEKPVTPKRSTNAVDGRYDVLFLLIFIFLMAGFLILIIFNGI